MAARHIHVDGFFCVLWGDATVEDFAAVRSAVAAAHESKGKPIRYLAVMPADLPPLSEVQRKEYMELVEHLVQHCERVAVVMEARGFRGAIVRSALMAVLLVQRRNDRVRFVDSVENGLEFVLEGAALSNQAVTRGLQEIERELPDSVHGLLVG